MANLFMFNRVLVHSNIRRLLGLRRCNGFILTIVTTMTKTMRVYCLSIAVLGFGLMVLHPNGGYSSTHLVRERMCCLTLLMVLVTTLYSILNGYGTARVLRDGTKVIVHVESSVFIVKYQEAGPSYRLVMKGGNLVGYGRFALTRSGVALSNRIGLVGSLFMVKWTGFRIVAGPSGFSLGSFWFAFGVSSVASTRIGNIIMMEVYDVPLERVSLGG